MLKAGEPILERFLLTRLSRGVTTIPTDTTTELDISTHTPLARRDPLRIYERPDHIFLLTRLSRGVTGFHRQQPLRIYEFLLTRLSRGVTFQDKTGKMFVWISTHTPLARRDRNILKKSCRPHLYIAKEAELYYICESIFHIKQVKSLRTFQNISITSGSPYTCPLTQL